MAANVGGSKGGAKAEINITPLVDVVLVLLIIFMVVSPGDSTYVSNAIPKPSLDNSEVLSNDQMVLELHADGNATLNQKTIERRDFSRTLKDLLSSRTDKKIFISAEDEVPYGEVVGWMGLAKTAGAVLMALKLNQAS